MPFLLRRNEGVRAFRHRFADDAGVIFCNSAKRGEPIGGLRLSHERHEYLEGRGRIVLVPEAIYDECRQKAPTGEGSS